MPRHKSCHLSQKFHYTRWEQFASRDTIFLWYRNASGAHHFRKEAAHVNTWQIYCSKYTKQYSSTQKFLSTSLLCWCAQINKDNAAIIMVSVPLQRHVLSSQGSQTRVQVLRRNHTLIARSRGTQFFSDGQKQGKFWFCERAKKVCHIVSTADFQLPAT